MSLHSTAQKPRLSTPQAMNLSQFRLVGKLLHITLESGKLRECDRSNRPNSASKFRVQKSSVEIR
jgi:hypothetical protein